MKIFGPSLILYLAVMLILGIAWNANAGITPEGEEVACTRSVAQNIDQLDDKYEVLGWVVNTVNMNAILNKTGYPYPRKEIDHLVIVEVVSDVFHAYYLMTALGKCAVKGMWLSDAQYEDLTGGR